MTEAAEPLFIDTNILVYASVDASPFHATALAALAELEARQTALWISRQVIREYLATLVRPSVGLPIIEVVATARSFETRYQVAQETSPVTNQLLSLLERGMSRQIHDTNIVATMLVHHIPRILTNNPDHFSPFKSLITVVPLA